MDIPTCLRIGKLPDHLEGHFYISKMKLRAHAASGADLHEEWPEALERFRKISTQVLPVKLVSWRASLATQRVANAWLLIKALKSSETSVWLSAWQVGKIVGRAIKSLRCAGFTGDQPGISTDAPGFVLAKEMHLLKAAAPEWALSGAPHLSKETNKQLAACGAALRWKDKIT